MYKNASLWHKYHIKIRPNTKRSIYQIKTPVFKIN